MHAFYLVTVEQAIYFMRVTKKPKPQLSNGTNIAIRKIEPRSKMDVSKTKQALILTRNERILVQEGKRLMSTKKMGKKRMDQQRMHLS